MIVALDIAARVILATAFLAAATAKVVGHRETRETVVKFGVPERLAAPFAIVLPLTEGVVAIALVSRPAAVSGAAVAVALLASFSIAIGVNLARGRRPVCRCFGGLSATPISSRTLIRNALLTVAALWIIIAGVLHRTPSLIQWTERRSDVELVLGTFIVILAGICGVAWWLLLSLLHQQGRMLLRLEEVEQRLTVTVPTYHPQRASAPHAVGLAPGTRAPAFALTGVDGRSRTLEALLDRSDNRPLLIVFVDANCGPCAKLFPELEVWEKLYAKVFHLVVIASGDRGVNERKLRQYHLRHALLDETGGISETYLAHGTPSSVAVQPDGLIGSMVAQGAPEIEALASQLAAGLQHVAAAGTGTGANGSEAPSGVRGTLPDERPVVGQLVQPFTLVDVHGESVSSDDLRGHTVLLSFWDPGCPYCSSILEQFKDWEKEAHEPSLVVISRGSSEASSALGFASPVLLDPSASVATSVGAPGTPSGVLIDESGRVASNLAIGETAVIRLLESLRPAYA